MRRQQRFGEKRDGMLTKVRRHVADSHAAPEWGGRGGRGWRSGRGRWNAPGRWSGRGRCGITGTQGAGMSRVPVPILREDRVRGEIVPVIQGEQQVAVSARVVGSHRQGTTVLRFRLDVPDLHLQGAGEIADPAVFRWRQGQCAPGRLLRRNGEAAAQQKCAEVPEGGGVRRIEFDGVAQNAFGRVVLLETEESDAEIAVRLHPAGRVPHRGAERWFGLGETTLALPDHTKGVPCVGISGIGGDGRGVGGCGLLQPVAVGKQIAEVVVCGCEGRIDPDGLAVGGLCGGAVASGAQDRAQVGVVRGSLGALAQDRQHVPRRGRSHVPGAEGRVRVGSNPPDLGSARCAGVHAVLSSRPRPRGTCLHRRSRVSCHSS